MQIVEAIEALSTCEEFSGDDVIVELREDTDEHAVAHLIVHGVVCGICTWSRGVDGSDIYRVNIHFDQALWHEMEVVDVNPTK